MNVGDLLNFHALEWKRSVCGFNLQVSVSFRSFRWKEFELALRLCGTRSTENLVSSFLLSIRGCAHLQSTALVDRLQLDVYLLILLIYCQNDKNLTLPAALAVSLADQELDVFCQCSF